MMMVNAILGFALLGYFLLFISAYGFFRANKARDRFNELVDWLAYEHPTDYKEWIDHRRNIILDRNEILKGSADTTLRSKLRREHKAIFSRRPNRDNTFFDEKHRCVSALGRAITTEEIVWELDRWNKYFIKYHQGK